ncbi:helix-turn-helix transcriptional regulator [Mucilaginibacter sp. CAU 1740]|uniref:helix-turn-helix domain-containing protein n=1 Tax=Mucilaginibacter sp. CAU 1740 TaxID=3140365 RepID=UPI00325ABFAD
MKALNERIRKIRREAGCSQGDIAGKLGISIPAYSKIETGVTDVNLSRLEQIANVFGISLLQLIDVNSDMEISSDAVKVQLISKRLVARDVEVMELQQKVIQLHEEIRQNSLNESI